MKIKMYEAKKAAFILYSRYKKAREENEFCDDRDLDLDELTAQLEPFNKLMGLLKKAGYPNDFFHKGETPKQVFDFYNRFEGKTNLDFIGHVQEFFKNSDPNQLIEIGSGWVLPNL